MEAGALRTVDLLPEHMPHLRALTAKYPPMDFCDAAVVRLAEIFPRARVLTTDSAHFTLYRRFRDRALTLMHFERGQTARSLSKSRSLPHVPFPSSHSSPARARAGERDSITMRKPTLKTFWYGG